MIVLIVLAVVLATAAALGITTFALRGLRPAPEAVAGPTVTGQGRWYANRRTPHGPLSISHLGTFELADGIASFTPKDDSRPLWSVPVQQMAVLPASWPHKGIHLYGADDPGVVYEFRPTPFGIPSTAGDILVRRTSRELAAVLVRWGARGL